LKTLSVWLFSIIFCCFSAHSALGQRFWVASTPGNWSDINNWSTTSGGAGGASVPGAGDLVTFNNTRVGSCTVDINPGTIGGLTITAGYTGSINLNGFTLTTAGANSLAGSSISGAGSTLAFNTTGSTTFSGTTINVPVTGTSGRLFFNGSVFNSTVDLIKTANNDDDGTGNNTFATTVALRNNSANRLRMATGNRDIFNGTLTFTLFGSGIIDVAYGSAVATQFNDNIIVNYINNSPLRFGFGSGRSILADTKTITVNPGAGGAGGLSLGGIYIVSGQTIALTGNTSSQLAVRVNTTFNGVTSLTAPSFSMAAGVFNGPLTIEKTGPSVDNLTGGNTYGSTVNIINSGAGDFNFAATNADTFNGNTQIDNTGTGRVQLGLDSPGNVINGSLTVNHGGSTSGINCILARNAASSLTINGTVRLNETNADASSGIIVGNDGDVVINGNLILSSTAGRGILFANASASASVTLGNGFSMSDAGAGTYTTGVLTIQRLTQLGTAAQSLNLTGNAVLTIGDANIFNGPVNFAARELILNATTFNNSAVLDKTGSGDDDGNGGAVFAGPTTIRNSGSGHLTTDGANIFNGITTIQNTGSDYISLEDNLGSTYNGPVEFNNSGSSNIRVARTGNTTFNENIVANSSSTGQILFCETAAATSATLVSGKTITTTGFTSGELRLQRFTQLGSTAQAITFGSPGTGLLRLGPSSTFNGNVTFVAPRIHLHGTTYNGTASIQKTGATADDGLGGNIFNGATTITNSGSNYLLTASTNPDTFNDVLTINNNGSSTIRLSDAVAGNAFMGNIVLNTSSGTGIYFGNGGGSSTLANDRTITAGSVLNGDIRLIRVVQVSSVNPQVLNLDGIATLTVGTGSQFGGDVDFRAPQLYLNGCIYGTTGANIIRLEKEGATENIGNGGNTFNGTTTIVNSGSNSLRSANVSPDVFNANLTINNTGTSSITLSYTVAGNQYNGNITFNEVLGAAGISFGSNGGSSTLTPTGALSIGPSGFVSGDLRFARFTQTGSLAQSLILTAPAAGTGRLRLGPASSFGGSIDFRAPRILLEGVTCNDVTYLEKTGATDDTSAGGNVFNGVTTIANSGSGWFINADAALDQFNNDLTITNTGSAGIRMADNIPGTVFKGNIIVNSTFGSGIYFCETNAIATAQLDPTKTITVGGLGFTTGDLRLRRFTQLGTTPQSFVLTGTAGLRLGPNATFNANVTFRAPQLFINTGSLYVGTATLEKTGATDNSGTGGSTFQSTTTIRSSGAGFLRTNGGNTFNGTTTLINSGSNDVILEVATGSTYNGDVEMINDGSSQLRAAYTGTTAFNGNVLVNCTSGTGIMIGETATAVNLATGRTIAVGASGFTTGELRLQRFIQAGTSTPQTLTLTGTALIRFQSNTTFNSAITVSSPRILFEGGIFRGTSAFTKTGTVNDDSNGTNTFNGTTTFTNNGTGRMRLATGAADTFGGNVTFVRANTGAVEPAYVGNSTFSGNITTNSATAIIFGASTGTQTFSGSNAQTIAKAGAASPQFNRIVVNKSGNGITLNTDATIGNSATFTNGIITSTTANFLNFANGATATGSSNASHVSGPVRKTGTDAFTFPVGKGGIYKSIGIGTRGAAGDQFTAEYFNTVQTAGSTMGPGLFTVSGCENWNLARTTGTSNVTVTLSWRNSNCPNTYVVNTTDLRVGGYNSTLSRWEDRGNGGVAGTGGGLPGEGTIVSSAAVSIFGQFALATSTSTNPLPIELVDFTAANMGTFVLLNWATATELNNDYFTVQRSIDGNEFSEIATLSGAGNSKREINYTINDTNPVGGVSYYRLKQADFDGHTSYSKVVKINRDEEAVLMIYPNPSTGGTAYTNIRGTFTIYNSIGQTQMSKEDTNEIDVSSLAAGVYLVRSASGQAFRLIIQ
jgi:Secretion system C-terminal sorting domain